VLTADLFPGAGLRLDDLFFTPDTAVALLVATAASAPCPRCGTPSDRVHSRYRRTAADLPWHDRPVALRLVVRRFRCINPACPQVVFCERLPALLESHARTTARLAGAHCAVGFALGGEAGARLARRLGMPTSPDTLLRRVKEAPAAPAPAPRYIGVDDWALRKGQRYGTIIIDLERGRVLDLLKGRDGEALKAWLKEHPGVEVITRDRWAAFAQAATEAAPQAQQVADRWHLLRNLREAVERLLGRFSAPVREALREALDAPPGATTPAGGGAEGVSSPAGSRGPLGPREQARQARRQERARLYERVQELRAQGESVRQIARLTGPSLKRVRRYLRSDRCPDWNPGRKVPTQLDPLSGQIDAWMERGGRNAAALYRELAEQGFRGSYDAVRRCLAPPPGEHGAAGPARRPPVPAGGDRPAVRPEAVLRVHPAPGGPTRRGTGTAGQAARVRRGAAGGAGPGRGIRGDGAPTAGGAVGRVADKGGGMRVRRAAVVRRRPAPG
jgi:hypothetical protein